MQHILFFNNTYEMVWGNDREITTYDNAGGCVPLFFFISHIFFCVASTHVIFELVISVTYVSCSMFSTVLFYPFLFFPCSFSFISPDSTYLRLNVFVCSFLKPDFFCSCFLGPVKSSSLATLVGTGAARATECSGGAIVVLNGTGQGQIRRVVEQSVDGGGT
jgi:hypothetical protein